MAAELVGTAYVRIRAITAGLASDISEGVDKGVKDADVGKAGEKLGGDLGDSTSEGFGKSLADGGIADGLTEAFDAPEVHKASEEGGRGVGKDVSKGVEDEHKKNNPFRSLLDSLKKLSFKGPAAKLGRETSDSFSDGVDEGQRRRNPFRRLFDSLKDLMPHFHIDMESAGEEGGSRFADGVEKGVKKKNLGGKLGKALGDLEMPKLINWAGIFGPTTLAPIIGGLLSGFGLIVEALGFIVTAAAGAGVALAGVAAVALPGLAVLFAAFKVQTKQLAKFKEAAKKLLKPWEQVGIATQEFLLPGIEDLLRAIQHLIPFFVEFGGHIGRIFGDLAKFVGAILTSKNSMRALGVVLLSSEAFFLNVRTAVLNLVDALMPFLEAVAPLGVKFSESLMKMATHLADMVKEKAGTGELAATFQLWYERAALLAGIIGDVLVGLWNILQIASTSGTPFFTGIAEAADKFRAWTSSAEGQNTIKKFFDDIQPVLDEVWDLIKNIFDLIVKPAAGDGGSTMFSNLATALHAINTVLENPVTAKVVPYLLGLVVALGLLSKVPTPILSGIGSALGWITEKFAKAIGSVAEAIGKLAWAITKFLIGALWDLSVALLTTPAGWILLTIAAAAIAVYEAFIHWDTVVDWLKQAWEWFTNLALPVKIIVGIFAGILMLVNPLVIFAEAVLLITAAIKNWDTIAEIVDRVWDALWNFFTNLPTLIPQALDAIVKFVTDLPEKLAPLGEKIINFFKEIPTKIKDALITGLENLPSAILDALGGLFDLGQNLLGLIADGIMFAAPKLLNFFITLPVKILTTLGTVLPKLLSIGIKIIGFILQGLAYALPRLFFFFLSLPFEILTLLRKALVGLVKIGIELIAALLRGIVRAGPRVMKWFEDLPGNLLSMLETAVKWLLEFGGKMLGAIIDGITENAGRLWTFFTNLPSTILGLLGDIGSALLGVGESLLSGFLDGVKQFWGSVSEFFGGLPQTIVDLIVAGFGLIVDIGGKIPGWILEGLTTLGSVLWDWFTALPGAILDLLILGAQTIIDLGGKLIGWIVEGLVALASTLWDWFTNLPQTIWDTLNSVVQAIIDIGGDLIDWIVDGLIAAAQTLWDWFLDLPSTIWDTLHGIISEIWGLGTDLIKWVIEGLEKAPSAIWDWFKGLPGAIWDVLNGLSQDIIDIGGDIVGWIIDGIGDLGSVFLKLLKDAWNWVADTFSFTIPIPVPGVDDIHIGLPHIAMGGVFGGSPLGIPVVIAEGGRAEAVVPMTRPSRALAVMQEAGLDKMVLDAYLGGSVPAGKAAIGDTTMLHIDTAYMTAPVDADMIVQKVTSAYNRLAS